MSNDALSSLLKEYEQKKLNAEMDLEKRKNNLYKLIPRLEQIDTELSTLGINTAKNILNNISKPDSVDNLKLKIDNLKREKEALLIQNKENFNNFNELLFSDEVDLAKYRFNISPRRNIINIKNKSIEFVNNFDNPEYKNLLFVGTTGLR